MEKDPHLTFPEQGIWLVTGVRRCECSPSRSFPAWPESAAIQQGWRGAESPPANEAGSFWRATADPKLGESPRQKPATEFHNWPAMAPYALHIVLPQPRACLQCSRVLRSCQPVSCFIIIFTVLLLFWEFQISVTALDALGEKQCLPPPPPLT